MKNEKGFFSRLLEHFATKTKLNKMTIKYNVKCEEYDEARRRNDAEKEVRKHMKEAYENSLKEITNEKVDLQLLIDKKDIEIKELKKKLRKKRSDKNEKQSIK